MVTKAEIQSIDFSGNTCEVRIPIFESSGTNIPAVTKATFAHTPGIYNSYKPGDVVWVGFDTNSYSDAVVLGKLYVGVADSSSDPRSALNIASLKVTDSAILPTDTKIVGSQNEAVQVADGGVAAFDSIGKVIDEIRRGKAKMDGLESGTIKLPGTNRTFVQDTEPQDANLRNGDLWVYTGETKYEEAQPQPKAISDFINKYIYRDGEYIYVTRDNIETVRPVVGSDTAYTKKEKGATFVYNTATTPHWTTVLSEGKPGAKGDKGDKGDAGEDSTSYWISVPVYVHTGIEQTQAITLTAIKQTGTQMEMLDNNVFWYINDVIYESNPSSTLTISAADIRNKYKTIDINIKACHEYMVEGRREYVLFDEETIEYSPDTPIVSLSQDVAQLKKDATEHYVDVTTTAKLYLSGQDISAKADFTWSNGVEGQTLTTRVAGTYICTVEYNDQEYTKTFLVSTLDDAVNYWLEISSAVHLGTNQTTPIEVIAKKKIGAFDVKDDNDATVYYKWASELDEQATQTAPATYKNEDLVIIAKHSGVEYERETITFSPKDVPVLDLSNDSESIAVDPTGNQIGTEEATSTATIYFNGSAMTSGVAYS